VREPEIECETLKLRDRRLGLMSEEVKQRVSSVRITVRHARKENHDGACLFSSQTVFSL